MKRLLLFLPIFLFFLSGCQNKDTQAELDTLKDIAALEEQNQALVEKYIGIWNSRDFDGLSEVLDPQFQVYIPSSADQPMSLDAYTEWFHGIVQGFPDIHYEIREIFASGDKVCLRWTTDANLPGADPADPEDPNKLTGGAIEIYTVKDGKITEERTEMDALGWQQQLGYKLVPPDENNQ
jgi:predicted ester cyclase